MDSPVVNIVGLPDRDSLRSALRRHFGKVDQWRELYEPRAVIQLRTIYQLPGLEQHCSLFRVSSPQSVGIDGTVR
jgi:hypothetical protein